MTDTPVHWPRGGSKSEQIAACVGSVNMAAQWPADPSGAPAIDGTHSHTLLEQCLRGEHRRADVWVGRELYDHEGFFTVDAARASRVQIALNYVWPLVDAGYELRIEEFTDAGKKYGIPQWGGPADVVLVDRAGGHVIIVDYKDGGKAVSPESNQMVTYGVEVVEECKPANVSTVIIQPKRSRDPLVFTRTIDEWNKVEAWLAERMRASMDPNAPRTAGDHCKYCPGAKPGRCPEFTEQLRGATVSINEAFANVPAVTQPGAVQTIANQPAPLQIPEINGAMSDTQLAQVLDAAPIIREMLKEAEAEGLKRAMSGRVPPGYKVTRKASQRRLTDNALEVLDDLRAKKHLKKEDYLEEKLKSAKQIIESDAVKGLSDRIRKRLDAIVIKPEGALQLVPESAGGKAVLLDTKEAFTDVPPAPAMNHIPAAPTAQSAPAKPSFL